MNHSCHLGEGGISMIETFKGVVPFFVSDGIRVAFIIFFPAITLILPRLFGSE